MLIDTNQILSITETNQNFSKSTRIADKQGSVLILKNNKPRYMIVSLQDNPVLDLSDEEKTDIVARRLLKKHRKAFEELAK